MRATPFTFISLYHTADHITLLAVILDQHWVYLTTALHCEFNSCAVLTGRKHNTVADAARWGREWDQRKQCPHRQVVGWKVGLNFLHPDFTVESCSMQNWWTVLCNKNQCSLSSLKMLCSALFAVKYSYWLFIKGKYKGFCCSHMRQKMDCSGFIK